MASTEESLARLVAIGEEQLRWQRAAVLPNVGKTIAAALDTTLLRQAYELCDGTRTATQIGKAVGKTQQTVSNWTLRWRELGFAYEEDGHIHHLVSLKALGLPIKVEGN